MDKLPYFVKFNPQHYWLNFDIMLSLIEFILSL